MSETMSETRIVKRYKVPCPSCSICLGFIIDDREKVDTPCNHSFHRECLQRWTLSGQANCSTCPYCRGDIRTVDLEDRSPFDISRYYKDRVQVTFYDKNARITFQVSRRKVIHKTCERQYVSRTIQDIVKNMFDYI